MRRGIPWLSAGGIICLTAAAALADVPTTQPAYPPLTLGGPGLDRAFLADMQDPPHNRAARDRLQENLNEIEVQAQGLEKVLNFLRDNSGINVFVNWTALQSAGIDRNTPITVSLKDVPFDTAFRAVLQKAGADSLAYTIDDGIVTISTKEDLQSAKYQKVKVFDIRDLIAQSIGPDATPRVQKDLDAFALPLPGTQDQRQRAAEKIIEHIQQNVATGSWRAQGGTVGSIRDLNGMLIVNQTSENLPLVLRELDEMLHAGATHLRLDSQIMLVPADFLSDQPIKWTDQGEVITGDGHLLPDGHFKSALIDQETLASLIRAGVGNGSVTVIKAPHSQVAAGFSTTLSCQLSSIVPADSLKVDHALQAGIRPVIRADGKSLILNLEILRISRASPAASGKQPVFAAAGAFHIGVEAAGIVLLDMGPVPPDFLTVNPPPGPQRRLLMLLRTTLLPTP